MTYHFDLSGHPRSCGDRSPHSPHAVDWYSTVRFGSMAYFCRGVSGDGCTIHVTSSCPPAPDCPARYRGTYTLSPDHPEEAERQQRRRALEALGDECPIRLH